MSSDRNTFRQQNDPAELLEVFDAGGRPTGRARSRGAVHVDGEWHQAFHCWIVRHGGDEIVLQRRSLAKDTFAGCWDTAAAGHWRFGETAEEAAREIAEELGLHIPFACLRYVGRERISRRFATGLIDREHHQVYLLLDDRPVLDYAPNPSEVMALGAFSAARLLELVDHRIDAVPASEAVTVRPDGTLAPASVTLTRATFVPYSSARLRRLLNSVRHG
jgi:isopentenyldiphosphate isomerase